MLNLLQHLITVAPHGIGADGDNPLLIDMPNGTEACSQTHAGDGRQRHGRPVASRNQQVFHRLQRVAPLSGQANDNIVFIFPFAINPKLAAGNRRLDHFGNFGGRQIKQTGFFSIYPDAYFGLGLGEIILQVDQSRHINNSCPHLGNQLLQNLNLRATDFDTDRRAGGRPFLLTFNLEFRPGQRLNRPAQTIQNLNGRLMTRVTFNKIEGNFSHIRLHALPAAAVVARSADLGNSKAHVRLQADKLFDPTCQFIAGLQVGPFRQFDFDKGTVGLSGGEKLDPMAKSSITNDDRTQQNKRSHHDKDPMPQTEFQNRLIKVQNARLALDFKLFFSQHHEMSAQGRVDHQGNKKRSRQGDNQGQGQKLHEFTHNSRPENHGEKGAQGRQGRADNRPAHFGGRHLRGLLRWFAMLHVAVNVFHHDNRIVDQHAQGQNQAEQHHHVEGHA